MVGGLEYMLMAVDILSDISDHGSRRLLLEREVCNPALPAHASRTAMVQRPSRMAACQMESGEDLKWLRASLYQLPASLYLPASR